MNKLLIGISAAGIVFAVVNGSFAAGNVLEFVLE